MTDAVYYAIGDVHGEADRLRALHLAILQDAAAHAQPLVILHLGDLIDRGPASREVIGLAMALEAAAQGSGGRIRAMSLLGNHEQMLLDAHDSEDVRYFDQWMFNGGEAALASYADANGAGEDWRAAIDANHLAWLRTLPTLAYDEDRRLAFVHAGIDPARFPDCAAEVRIWTRSERFFKTRSWPKRAELEGLTVVHGHTPTADFRPDVVARRINIDTGAVFGGPLTAVALAPGAEPRFLAVD